MESPVPSAAEPLVFALLPLSVAFVFISSALLWSRRNVFPLNGRSIPLVIAMSVSQAPVHSVCCTQPRKECINFSWTRPWLCAWLRMFSGKQTHKHTRQPFGAPAALLVNICLLPCPRPFLLVISNVVQRVTKGDKGCLTMSSCLSIWRKAHKRRQDIIIPVQYTSRSRIVVNLREIVKLILSEGIYYFII